MAVGLLNSLLLLVSCNCRVICWKSSAGRSEMTCLWAGAGHKSIIFYLSCSIQNILSVHSMIWRQLIHLKFMEDCFLHMYIIYIFKQQILPYLSIKEGKPVSLLLVSNFWLLQNQLTALFRSRLNIWNKHWILLFISICFFPQTKKSPSVVFWSLCSSHFWLYVHMAIYFINLLPWKA